MKKIPLIKPYITDEVKQKVSEVLESGYITEGPVTREFENVFTKYIKCDFSLAVTSCTTGLEIALRSLKIVPGDEIIVPDYTYPATANVASIVGAKAVIVDVSSESMLIDYDEIEKAITKNTKAIIPVSLFGNPLNYSILNSIKDKYGIFIVEDSACSIGAEYKGKMAGNLADISVFSLHPRKFITTGEGGIITCNESIFYEWMLSYKHFGMGIHDSRLTTTFDRVGTNYKMSDILSAVGLVQMHHIDDLLSKRRELSHNYVDMLYKTPGIKIPKITEGGKHSYQSFCIFVDNRDEIMMEMRRQGIECQIGTYSLHMHKAFKDENLFKILGDMAGSTYAFNHCLALPLYHEMTTEEQEYVVNELKKAIR
jgi:dTDP-4-amino-4,6-dideoxygalactose transaminase